MSSADLFRRAQAVIPGGVNSPVRAFKAVGGSPVFAVRGRGARIITADGAELTDYCGSWGPLILGHAREEVVKAVCDAVAAGATFGIATPREVEMAERLHERIPYLDKVRLVNSGTEAVMTALRIARGFRGRRLLLKFDGGYHGHTDSMLVSAGSGVLTGGQSASAGVSAGVAAETLVCPYNDLAAVGEAVASRGVELAAIIVEPVAGNMGLVPPAPGFLAGLRRFADACGAVLIFDEVITGFRLGPTAYGVLCGVTPDLTCLGKIIGGGLPIGAVGGRRELMDLLAPLGPVYQAGTLSGNPAAVAAGLAMLDLLVREDPYARLTELGARLGAGVEAAARAAGVPLCCARLGGMFTPFFCPGPVANLADAKRSDTAAYARFFHGMLERGIYLPPAQFEAAFISAAHTEADIRAFISAAGDSLHSLKA